MSAQKTLVFLYGVLGCIDQFDNQQAALSDRYNLVMMDWFIPCQQAVPCNSRAFDAISANLAAQLRDLNLQSTVLVGHSMGGALALSAIANYGAQVAGLVIIDTALTPSDEKKQAYHTISETLLFGVEDESKIERVLRDTFFKGSPAGQRLDSLVESCSQQLDPLWFCALSAAVDQDYPVMLSKLTCPILYLHRDGSDIDVARLRAALPTIQIKGLYSHSHYLQVFDADAVNLAIKAFVDNSVV